MTKYYLIIGSVTHAIMARDILRDKGFDAVSVKTPAGMDKRGCGYSVTVTRNPDAALSAVESGGISVTGVFKERA